MALNLSDLMKKAKEKGIGQNPRSSPHNQVLTRPWQEESILFKKPGNNQGTIEGTRHAEDILNQDSSTNKNKILEQPGNNEGTIEGTKSFLKEESLEKNSFKVAIRERTREQSGNKLGNIERTSREQPENNQRTTKERSREQRGNNQGTTREQPGNNLDNKPGNDLGNNSIPDRVHFLVHNLIGLQKKMFDYVLDICIDKGELNTGAVSTKELSTHINCSYESTKMTIKRLIAKGLVKRLKGKGCRGGFIILEVPRHVKSIALERKNAMLTDESGNKPGNEPGNNRENMILHTSSSSINTTTTINIEPLTSIGFNNSHLNQLLCQNKLSDSIIQNSIYAFAFDLENNNKSKSIKGSPLNFFMGILKNGQPYIPPHNYETPEDKAMRLYIEKMKEVQEQRELLEKELREVDFKSWEASLSDDEKNNILPLDVKNQKIQAPKLAFRRQFHQENIWPDKRKLILGSM